MNRIYLKSIVSGFCLGAALFAIAPLGLGFYFIEALKPVLVPGLLLTQLVLGNNVGAVTIIVGLVVNGAIFTIPFFGYFLSRKSRNL